MRGIYFGLAPLIFTAAVFAGPQEDFLAAAKRDNLKLMQKIHTAGAVDLNVADDKGKNAVVFACEYGNLAALTWLAESSADLAAKDTEGNTCIHLATKAKKPAPVFAFAIEKGIDKNAPNTAGETALNLTIRTGRFAAFQELLKLEVDKASAVSIAYTANQWKMFEVLVKGGAPLDITHEKSGNPLLIEMVTKDQIAWAKMLIENNANVNLADAENNSVIAISARRNLPDLLPPLIARGLPIESQDAAGKTLMQIAHENIMKKITPAREKLFKTVLELGANASTLSPSGRSILMEQSESGRYYQVKQLLDKNADVNFRDTQQNTVLHSTAARNQLGTFKLIVEKFADVNITGDSGNTAVHAATKAGGTGILQVLKTKGANFELKNAAGDTALAIAIGRQDPATARALLSLGASLKDEGLETPLMMEIAKSSSVNYKTAELLAVLKKAGANINATNRFGNNALAYSLNRKNIKMAEAFLTAGAEPQQGDVHGNTLLHKLALASKFNRVKNSELTDWLNLVLSYEHPDFQNTAGETALHLAADKENNPDLEGAHQFFEALVNFGASASVVDKSGKSVYDRARKLDWGNIAWANLPAGAIAQSIPQVLVSPTPDKLLALSTSDRDFYIAASLGETTRLIRFNDELSVKAQLDLPMLQALVAVPDGVIVAGVRPGAIDGEPDKKCKEGKNLVIYVTHYNASLEPVWENTWGKAGICQRTAALALGYNSNGNTLLYADFAGRRSLKILNKEGGLESTEVMRNDKVGEFISVADGNFALAGLQNLVFNPENGKAIGKITKTAWINYLALAPNGTRYMAFNFKKLTGRKGLTLTAEDVEGKPIWSKNYVSEQNINVESIVASDERICMTGKTDATMHGQTHSTAGKMTDYYVLCTDAQGTRQFTRLIPATGMTLAHFKVSKSGVVALIFQTQDKKNPDLILYRIDKEGRVFN